MSWFEFQTKKPQNMGNFLLIQEAVCITAATLQPNEMHMKFGAWVM